MAGPCEVWFYHLERTALDRALPELLEKTLAKGWRAVVRAKDQDRIEHLDGWLWAYRDESFLPHGVAEEPHAARQPVLLTTGFETENSAQALFLIDDAEPGALDGFERCMILFDGRDEGALSAARARWKALKTQGAAVSYWKQTERGGWEKAA
jgi:DNA polymerase-3 subunit chi